jgi:ATP-dependent Clp protease ATP-binding subunit ClpC
LVREPEGVAAQVLMNRGLKLEKVREEVLSLLGEGMEAGQRQTVTMSGSPREITGDLAEVLAAWDRLPEAIHRAILAMVRDALE